MVICLEASSAQNSMAAVPVDGSAVGLDSAFELLVEALDGVAGPGQPPLARRRAREGEQLGRELINGLR
jgi:hypothetical protein